MSKKSNCTSWMELRKEEEEGPLMDSLRKRDDALQPGPLRCPCPTKPGAPPVLTADGTAGNNMHMHSDLWCNEATTQRGFTPCSSITVIPDVIHNVHGRAMATGQVSCSLLHCPLEGLRAADLRRLPSVPAMKPVDYGHPEGPPRDLGVRHGCGVQCQTRRPSAPRIMGLRQPEAGCRES